MIIIIIYYFYKGTYNYVPETYDVCRVYSVAFILWLHYMVLVILFPMMNVWGLLLLLLLLTRAIMLVLAFTRAAIRRVPSVLSTRVKLPGHGTDHSLPCLGRD
jgi:hypothetical protein